MKSPHNSKIKYPNEYQNTHTFWKLDNTESNTDLKNNGQHCLF